MNVVLDHGNSRSKIGIFDQHVEIDKIVFTEKERLRFFMENFSGESIIISSVSQDVDTLIKWAKNFREVFILSPSLPVPVNNNYATPQTLGMDRLAAVCGAWQKFPGRNTLVIDAGTCITYDFIDSKGNFLGGGISPGLRMRFKALNKFTARLPLAEPVDVAPLIGNSTQSCIQSGVINGVIEELNGIIKLYSERFSELQTILCGGDTAFFENKLKGSIFAGPNLVLSGLNSILLHNVKH